MQKFFVSKPVSMLCLTAALAVTTWGGSTALAEPLTADETVTREAQAAQNVSLNEAAQAEQTPRRHQWKFNTGMAYQTRSDIDGGGDYSVSRFSGNGGVAIQLTEKLNFNFNAGFERHDYRFSSVTRMGNDPWENVNILALQAAIGYQINPHWTVYGTPLLSMAAEDGAELTRAATGGVAFGAHYARDEKFNIGFGLGVISQLEDSVTVFPIIRFNWQFADQWTLRSGSFTLGVQGGAGMELEWKPDESLALAGGVQYQLRRFRLDDRGIAPEGLGEESGVPVYLRLTWLPCQNFTVSGFAGVVLGGRLELMDEDGHTLTRKNFDPAFICGARVGVKF